MRKRWDAALDRIPDDRHVVGVEIGVWRGAMSRGLLAGRELLTLWMVDPWKAGEPETPWWKSGSVCPHRTQGSFESAYGQALLATDPYARRRMVVRRPSVEAAEICAGMQFDFAFIDGDHSYEGCRDDILAWLPLMRPGGWIGGHDWDRPEAGKVTEAVLSVFSRDRVETDAEYTWFVEVP